MQPERGRKPEGEALPADEVDFIAAEFGGDQRRALVAALAEIHRLEHELVMTRPALSFGFSRGGHHKRRP